MGIYDREEVVERAHRRVKIGSAVLIASGALPIFLSLVAGLSGSLALGLALLAAGLAHGILALGSRDRGNSLWLLVVSATFLTAAMTVVAKQDIPVATMALVFAASFLIEATAEIVHFAIARRRSGSSWALADAISTISIALLICSGWVKDFTWVLEIVVSVAWIISGLTWILRSQESSSYNPK